MNAVIFDIDGTLLHSAAVDDALYRKAVQTVLGDVRLRPALQDLAGDHTGYLPNSHLEMFHLRLRFDNEARRPAIEKLSLIEIISGATVFSTIP